MIDCEKCRAKLDAYIDRELSSGEMEELDRHVADCKACSIAALNLVQQKEMVRKTGKAFAPSPEFRTRIEKQILRRQPFWARLNWVPAMAAVAAVLIFAILVFATQRSRERQTISELVDMHIATMASANPVDVVSTDRHTVKPWFQGKLPFTFDLPEIANTPFTLVGGRMTYLGQSPGAHLLYRVRQHNISVFVFAEDNVSSTSMGAGSAESFRVRTWSSNGLRYVMLTEAPKEDAEALEKLFRHS